MGGGDHSYPSVQLTVWYVTKGKLHEIYISATYLKLPTISILTEDNSDQLLLKLLCLLHDNT